MRMIRHAIWMLAGLLIAGCGGANGPSPYDGAGGGDGGGGGGNPTPGAATIDMLASSTQLGTGGDPVTISAIVKAAGNVSLPGVTVAFGVDTGSLTVTRAVTDANGVATATLAAGSNKANRTARMTATSGTVTGALDVAIDGSTLVASGVTTLALGSTTNLSVRAQDSRGNAIAGVSLAVASSLGNGLSTASITTNAQGSATVTYTATNPGGDTITFTGLGTMGTSTMTVSGEDFSFTSPAANQQIPVATAGVPNAQALVVRYRSNGVAQAGVTVDFASTAGLLSASSAVTNANGEASVTISSATAAAATVQATLRGSTSASATLPLQFIATTPATLVLQASPTAIGPNVTIGSTAQQARVQARVTDANGNPVANRTVNFSRDVDPSGGNLSQPSAVTDLNGVASVQYFAGPQSTANNGVQLRGTVSGTAGTAITGVASLSVNQAALFIALGTGNVIANIDPQTYRKDWVAYVTDSNGIAVSGVTLTIRVLPTRYWKGILGWNGSSWAYRTNAVSPPCDSEDANENGVLDGVGTPTTEDENGNGTLQPGNVISVTPGTVQTDATGRATLSVIYAESYAPWVEVELSVTAIVSGTESTTSTIFTVIGSTADFTNEDTPPAGVNSPFGTQVECRLAN
jgi:Bacterial Ig-like domain (group 1)